MRACTRYPSHPHGTHTRKPRKCNRTIQPQPWAPHPHQDTPATARPPAPENPSHSHNPNHRHRKIPPLHPLTYIQSKNPTTQALFGEILQLSHQDLKNGETELSNGCRGVNICSKKLQLSHQDLKNGGIELSNGCRGGNI